MILCLYLSLVLVYVYSIALCMLKIEILNIKVCLTYNDNLLLKLFCLRLEDCHRPLSYLQSAAFCLFVCFETGSHCVAQAGLELTNLLPQPP
jgi:hypothetical protein